MTHGKYQHITRTDLLKKEFLTEYNQHQEQNKIQLLKNKCINVNSKSSTAVVTIGDGINKDRAQSGTSCASDTDRSRVDSSCSNDGNDANRGNFSKVDSSKSRDDWLKGCNDWL